MKKRLLVISSAIVLTVGSLSVYASAFNHFTGGVTGTIFSGTTWGDYNPRGYSVYVTVKGKKELTKKAKHLGNAHPVVARAVNGNKSYWGKL